MNIAKMVPKKIFFTKGLGIHREKLHSFEMALRDADIERCNLVRVSSILPPHCRTISRKSGIKYLRAGQITFCVMSDIATNEYRQLISAAVGLARPSDPEQHGYLSEHHAYGQSAKVAGDYAEDLAAEMLASTLGIPFDAEADWFEREQVFKSSGLIINTRNTCQSAQGVTNGQWTTVLSAAVLIFED